MLANDFACTAPEYADDVLQMADGQLSELAGWRFCCRCAYANSTKGELMNIQRLFGLNGRVALVTGGSAGLGKSIAEGLIAAGARVYISSRKVDVCERVAGELGDACIALPANVTTSAGCENLAAQLQEREGVLDILVNNAGIAWGERFEDFSEIGWDKVMDLNVRAPFFLTQKLCPLLTIAAKRRGPAKVINIASIDGLRLNTWETYSYQASKAAIVHLTRRLAARLVRDNINVSAIAPGAFPSNMNRAARDRSDTVSEAIPAGRVGQAEDIAAAAIYLASRAGDYVVGSTLVVDGGLVNAELGASIDG